MLGSEDRQEFRATSDGMNFTIARKLGPYLDAQILLRRLTCFLRKVSVLLDL